MLISPLPTFSLHSCKIETDDEKKKIKNPLSLSDSTTRDYNRQGKDEKGEWKKRRQTEGLKIEKGGE